MEMPEAFAENCEEHYMKAVEKHPYFADRLFLNENEKSAASDLKIRRLILQFGKSVAGHAWAESLLRCEISEAGHAFATGDKAHAVDECYDAIAVLMRMIAVMEGKQKLGGGK